jgi:uncharacterized protein YqhQ
MSEKYPWLRFPILRGLGTIGQAMTLGTKALKFSANVQLAEEEAKQTGKAADQKKTEITGGMMTVTLVLNFLFFVFLYKFVPLFLATRLGHVVPSLSGRLATNITDGLIRMAILMGFLYALSRFQDIRRVFAYHGAEHKVVFNYESGKPVTVENAQKFVTFHPRCGTNFMLVVMFIAMAIYAFLPIDGFLPKLLWRIALLPFILGLSYELIRFAARRQGSLMGLLSVPGLWLQRVTTKPPDDTQTGVAIHALNGAMALEAKQGGELVIA